MITMRQYAAGKVIFSENDVGETAYIIVRGRVEVLKMLEGKNVHLASIGAGEPLGEMGVIDEKPRSATVVAVEETVVRELHRDDLFQNLQEHPEVAISLLKVFSSACARPMRRFYSSTGLIQNWCRSNWHDSAQSLPNPLPSYPCKG